MSIAEVEIEAYPREVDTARVEADEVELTLDDSGQRPRMTINLIRSGSAYKTVVIIRARHGVGNVTCLVRRGSERWRPACIDVGISQVVLHLERKYSCRLALSGAGKRVTAMVTVRGSLAL